jgi:hypothetical protein
MGFNYNNKNMMGSRADNFLYIVLDSHCTQHPRVEIEYQQGMTQQLQELGFDV